MPDAVERKGTESDRSGAGASDPPTRAAPSLAILGADALLAAQPATAIQLAHACVHASYQAVVPASWGDELVAAGCLRQIATRRGTGSTGPAIFCACPYVAHRLLAAGPDLEPFLASFVAPAVAVARYLRALYAPTRIRLTYIGRCPGAADDSIDARITPEELLAVLTERGIDVTEQPRAFDSVIPPDRRRFLSQPGGLPTAEMLRRVDPDRRVLEIAGPELVTEVAQQLLSKSQVLLDVATRLGCACSGAVADTPPEAARSRVTTLEPPRATSPVVDDRVPITIELPLPNVARDPVDVVPAVASKRSSGASRVVPMTPEPPAAPEPTTHTPHAGIGRRRSPTHGIAVRQQPGSVPTTRSGEGRALPRAYVARRGQRSAGSQRSTPPRGEPQRFDASNTSPGRAGNGGAPRGGGRAPRGESSDAAQAAPSTPMAVAPAGEASLRAPERSAVAMLGAAPDHAADPHGEPVVTEMTLAEPAPHLDAAPSVDPRAASPHSEVNVSRGTSFRVRTAQLARVAVSAAHRRRALLAALLGVALISATVGVLTGRWLAQ